MAEKLNNPDGYSLEEVHALFQSAFREHLKQDLCTPVEKDTPQTFSLKSATAHQFDSGRPTADILSDYAAAIERIAPNPDAAAFASAINNSRSQEERAHIYMNYYCRPAWADSPQQKAFKVKYARMFEALVPHDEVLAAMKKEAADSQANKIDVLQREISELQMAQSAHMKVKAKKEERHERMILDREPSPKMVQCSLDGCANEVDLLGATIECAICEWLHRKGGERGRYVYCSVEHADEDFVSRLPVFLWCCRKADEHRMNMIVTSMRAAWAIAACTTRKQDHLGIQTQLASARTARKRNSSRFSARRTAFIITWYVLGSANKANEISDTV